MTSVPSSLQRPATDEASEPPRQRRRRGEPRRLLIESARELFAQSGYSGVSSREVAQHAGLNEALVYRYFKSKAQLFDRAVEESIRDCISDYVESMRQAPESLTPVDVPTREFFGRFYDELLKNRRLFMAFVAAHAFEDDVISLSSENEPPFRQMLDELRGFVDEAAKLNNLPDQDWDLLTRWVILFIVGIMLEEWLLPPLETPKSRDHIVEEITQLWVHGLAHRPTPPAPARRGNGSKASSKAAKTKR